MSENSLLPVHDSSLQNWNIIFQSYESGERSLVLYNPRLRQVRTCSALLPPDQNSTIISNYSSRQYFQILHDLFRSNGALPPPLSDFLMNGYFDKFFPVRKKIGKGSYGSVYKVEHILAGIRLAEYAVKIVPVGEFNWLRRALNEVRLLEELSVSPHPFVLSYKHCWIEDWQTATFGPKVPCLFILMEYSPLGSLDKLLQPKNPREGDVKVLSEDEMWQIFISIAIALKHLHSNGIIHRDLKFSNVLGFTDNHYHPLNYRLALCDFGTAASMGQPMEKRTGATGTIETMAPELLEQNHEGEFLYRHNFSSDVWSLGVILFTLYTRRSPFVGERGEELLRNFHDPDTLVEDLGLRVDKGSLEWKWIKRFMQAKPGKRYRIDDFLDDSLIRSKIKFFGFDGLLEKNSTKHVIVSSPSLDELNNSTPLALKHDENAVISMIDDDFSNSVPVDQQSMVSAESAANAVSSVVSSVSKKQQEKTEVEKKVKRFKVPELAYLLLASLSLTIQKQPFMTFHFIASCVICAIASKRKVAAILIPILVAGEIIQGCSSNNIFVFLLTLVIALSVVQEQNE